MYITVDFQDQQCAKAKLEIQLQLERFGNDYFYTLGLNKKFCAGIGDFFRSRIISSWLKDFYDFGHGF